MNKKIHSIFYKVTLAFLFFSLFLFGQNAHAHPTCQHYRKAQKSGNFANKKIDECSGLTSSKLNKGVWWTHNDSGGRPRIYAFDKTGKDLGYFDVPGASNFDWEDIATGPCPDGRPCIYIADIGDNMSIRPNIRIYRVHEPKVDINNPTNGKTELAAYFVLTYPDGAHDCETLFIHPKTHDIILVSKERKWNGGNVYVLPGHVAPGKATLRKVTTLKLPNGARFTGGDISPNGDQVVLRTYSTAYLYNVDISGIPTEKNKLMQLAMPFMTQGEAIGYSADARTILTATENRPAPIFELSCLDPIPPKEPKKEKIVQPEPTQEKQQRDAGNVEVSTKHDKIPDNTIIKEKILHQDEDFSQKETQQVQPSCGCSMTHNNSIPLIYLFSIILLFSLSFSNKK